MKDTLLFLLATLVIVSECTKKKKCEISIDYRKGDLQEPQPLVLTDSKEPTFFLPNDKKLLIFPTNTSILLACPGRNNSLENHGTEQTVKAICLEAKQFLVNSSVYDFKSFKCKYLPRETVKKTRSNCLTDHQIYSINFTVGKVVLPLLEICRDEKTYTTYYSKIKLAKELYGFQSNYPRPSWKYGTFYPGYNMNAMYKLNSQLRSMEILLSSKELAHKYIRLEDQQFLNRGHLAAKADFIYGVQQKATFWHLNTGVQWASFNGGNWMIVEYNVRVFAMSRRMDLLVYTGVHGITSLVDVNGNDQPLYLHVNQTHRVFPVPRFFWKIIHDPITNHATAFVGLNEPFAKNITRDMYLCPDIGNDPAFSWLTWEPNNTVRGISYVCAVEELRKAIPSIPYIGEVGILV